MSVFRALIAERETRVALAIWVIVPTLFLFFALTLAVDPAAHVDRLRLGTTVLDAGVTTPQGQVAVGPRLVAGLHEQLGAEIVAYPTEAELRDAVLAREVGGGLVVPAGATQALMAGAPVALTIVRSDADDSFTNAFTTNLATSLAANLNASMPALLGGTPAAPTVSVATQTVAATADFRFVTLPGSLLLPLWMAGVAFVVLLSRAGDRVRQTGGITRTGLAEVAVATIGAALTAVVITLDIALFTWHGDIDLVGLFALLWLGVSAIGWLLLGLVRAAGLVLGALLGVLALFLQQPISGAAYPADFAPDVVRWAEPVAPLRYIVEGLRNVLIGGSTMPDMAVALTALAVVGLVLVGVGMARLSLLSRHPTVGAPIPVT